MRKFCLLSLLLIILVFYGYKTSEYYRSFSSSELSTWDATICSIWYEIHAVATPHSINGQNFCKADPVASFWLSTLSDARGVPLNGNISVLRTLGALGDCRRGKSSRPAAVLVAGLQFLSRTRTTKQRTTSTQILEIP